MRARFFIPLILLMVIWIAINSFDPMSETYIGMQVRSVAGKPYLILQEYDSFSVYEPAEKEIEGWRSVYENRKGMVLGTFEFPESYQPPATETKTKKEDAKTDPEKPVVQNPSEAPEISAPPTKQPDKTPERRPSGLGFFFRQRCAVFDVAKRPNDSVSFPLQFDWIPEASAELNGKIYAFGAEDPERETNLTLHAAVFDGQNWAELTDTKGPAVRHTGFWLQAVTLNGRIALLWREAKFDQTIGQRIEGPRVSTDGEIKLAFFDGTNFKMQTAGVNDIPKGNTCVWAENGAIKCLVQTRIKGVDAAGKKGRMEIWKIAPDSGKAELSETIEPERNTLGLFSFLTAERFVYGQREYILRSTWQKFELWRRNDSGKWEVVPKGASGLPAHELEQRLYTAVGFCVGVVLLGAWMAYMRRRQALTLLTKLTPRDLYAPLGTRALAFIADIILVFALALATKRFYPEPFVDLFPFPSDFLVLQPAWPFAAAYGVYFIGSEWLFGATLGKFLMGLRVVGDSGRKASLWSVIVRNMVGLYERQPYMLLVAAPMIVFSPRRQRLGDLLSQTFVVQKQGLDLFMAQQAALGEGKEMERLPDDPVVKIEKKTNPRE
ncbi:MAG TPA: RDD family protein [Planctomycetota bacterium]|nr:RDD family protein [Planctomycetota bacterium]